MIQTLNKNEKIDLYWKALQKHGNSITLYYHFLTVKEKWYNKIKENDKNV